MNSLRKFLLKWGVDDPHALETSRTYPFRISNHYSSLIRSPGDPIWNQCVPDGLELKDQGGLEDPLAECALSPVPNLVHRYPGRVLWIVSKKCAINCRFCTRKRIWNSTSNPGLEDLEAGIDYIRKNHQIRDVLLSGGDPLLLPPVALENILSSLRTVPHVETIRIGTRVPCASPSTVTQGLANMLAGYHPLFINIHFNHPREITPESSEACAKLANAGIPLGSQSVLLRGINDDANTLGELFQGLLAIRVRPYYLMQMDLVRSTAHFRTPIAVGLRILRGLRNFISGMAMPQFVIDMPGGRGKVPLLPDYLEEISADRMLVRNYMGEMCEYPLLTGEGCELKKLLGRT